MSPTSEPLPAVSPRTDLIGGFVWIGFGALVVTLAWQMDRLESQGGTLYTAPGSWPGLVGFLIALLGGLLVARSVRRASRLGWHAAQTSDVAMVPRSQFALAVAMMLIYALLMVGRGLPFWLATALFVSIFVFAFRRAAGGDFNARSVGFALACGLATAAIVSLAFERLFYVRLP